MACDDDAADADDAKHTTGNDDADDDAAIATDRTTAFGTCLIDPNPAIFIGQALKGPSFTDWPQASCSNSADNAKQALSCVGAGAAGLGHPNQGEPSCSRNLSCQGHPASSTTPLAKLPLGDQRAGTAGGGPFFHKLR